MRPGILDACIAQMNAQIGIWPYEDAVSIGLTNEDFVERDVGRVEDDRV